MFGRRELGEGECGFLKIILLNVDSSKKYLSKENLKNNLKKIKNNCQRANSLLRQIRNSESNEFDEPIECSSRQRAGN